MENFLYEAEINAVLRTFLYGKKQVSPVIPKICLNVYFKSTEKKFQDKKNDWNVTNYF